MTSLHQTVYTERKPLGGAEPPAWHGGGGPISDGIGFSWTDPRWLSDRKSLDVWCRAYLEQVRWPEGVRCSRCDSREVGRIPARRKFYCRACRYHFSVTAGTIFHNSHLPVWKWFLAVSAMLASEAGVPSNQLVQMLGGSYKTAWFAQHRIRTAIRDALPTDGCCQAGAAANGRCGDDGPGARIFDRSTVGPYHQMGVRYMGAYVAEAEWRRRCRRNPQAFRETITRLVECDPLAYDDLIARARQHSA
jgi:transposase-like protein